MHKLNIKCHTPPKTRPIISLIFLWSAVCSPEVFADMGPAVIVPFGGAILLQVILWGLLIWPKYMENSRKSATISYLVLLILPWVIMLNKSVDSFQDFYFLFGSIVFLFLILYGYFYKLNK